MSELDINSLLLFFYRMAWCFYFMHFAFYCIVCTMIRLKGKGSGTVKPKQGLSISKTKLFGANFMQIGQ